MKFKLDENFGPTVRQVFERRGHDCQTVLDEGLGGADDPIILAAATGEKRILVTMDHDFGNVLNYPPASAAGIAIVNVRGRASRQMLAALLESFLIACEQQQLRGRLWIVEPGRIREHESE